ncbi:hypothetical protein KCU65_g1953, partial [Aureobasidium melanogenum]
MDDGYQDVIRGSPVDRKPDRAVLDAAFGAEMQAPGPLHWYNPTVYTQAVHGATLGAGILIKESFERSIAYTIGGVAPEVDQQHLLACDPDLYHNAIQNATLNGRLLKEKFDQDIARIEYHPISLGLPSLAIRQSTEPRAFGPRPESMRPASQARESQATHTPPPPPPPPPPPHRAQANHDHLTRSQTVQRQPSAHRVDTQVSPHPPAHPRPRVRRASPLPEQKNAWADHKRGRGRRRRSRSPPIDRQNEIHPTNYRRRASSVRSDQAEDSTLHGRYRDHCRASHINTTGDGACDATSTPALEGFAAAAPADNLPSSTSEIQHNPPSTELCFKSNVDHTNNYQTPETPLEPDHPSALQFLPNDHGNRGHGIPEHNILEHDIHEHDVHEHNHNRTQAKSNANNAYASTSVLSRPLLPSIIEPLQRKNQHAVCIECWSRGSKCDSKVVCGECAKRARPCSYVQCPLRACPRDIKCPAYHSWRGDDETRVVGNPMHLMVLLRLGPPSLSPGYNLSEIQRMSDKHNSAQEIYRRIAADIKEGEDSGKRIDNTFVKQLVLKCGVAVGSSDKALMPKVNLIVDFVAQQKKPRYQEPYKREQRALRFGPTS